MFEFIVILLQLIYQFKESFKVSSLKLCNPQNQVGLDSITYLILSSLLLLLNTFYISSHTEILSIILSRTYVRKYTLFKIHETFRNNTIEDFLSNLE